MNKYLMLSAAALVATAAGSAPSRAASSGSVTIAEHNGSITYCDYMTITWSGNNYADIHYWDPCGLSSTSYGMGISGYTKGVTAGKKKTKPNNVGLSDYYKGDVSAGYEVTFQLGLPFKSGNAFNGYYTTNGKTVTEYIEGTYTLSTPGAVHPRGGPSTRDALLKKIEEQK